jgi:hypothetical protein
VLISLWGKGGMKKSPQVQRADKDIGKVLKRYLFTLTTNVGKLLYV